MGQFPIALAAAWVEVVGSGVQALRAYHGCAGAGMLQCCKHSVKLRRGAEHATWVMLLIRVQNTDLQWLRWRGEGVDAVWWHHMPHHNQILYVSAGWCYVQGGMHCVCACRCRSTNTLPCSAALLVQPPLAWRSS